MSERHFTTRRGFVGAMGFGALGLYATWAAYGASPLPFTLAPAPGGSDAHAGHGAPTPAPTAGQADPAVAEAHGAGAMSPAEFERRHDAFLKRFRRADGSVRPTAAPAAADHDHGAAPAKSASMPEPMPGGHAGHAMEPVSGEHAGHVMPAPAQGEHAGHAMPEAAVPNPHAGHGDQAAAPAAPASHDAHAAHGAAPSPAPAADPHAGHGAASVAAAPMPAAPARADHAAHGEADSHAPVEVFLAAGRFSFEPDDIRLEAGRAYRFHMMATDVAHGASIAFGRASRIVRLRPDTVTTLDLTFREAGAHLVYCTVYCGPGHDGMHAAITVA